MRPTTTAVANAIEAPKNSPVHLLEITLGAMVYRMTNAYIPLIWGGNEYSQAGHFLNFSDIEESAQVEVSKLTISLSGIDQVYVNELLSEDYLDRPIRIYKAFLDSASDLILDPFLIFEGRIDSPVITENPDDGTAVISVSASNSWVDFERLIGRYTNHEAQSLHFPGDKGFEFASEVVGDVVWGKAS